MPEQEDFSPWNPWSQWGAAPDNTQISGWGTGEGGTVTGNQPLRPNPEATEEDPAPTQHHEAPAKHHGKGGKKGGSGGSADYLGAMSDMMQMYTDLIADLLGTSNEPGASEADGGSGFEDTVLTRRVLGQHGIGLRSLYNLRHGPQRRVIDPLTGTVYATPEAAMQAGVTNYSYLPAMVGSIQGPKAAAGPATADATTAPSMSAAA